MLLIIRFHKILVGVIIESTKKASQVVCEWVSMLRMNKRNQRSDLRAFCYYLWCFDWEQYCLSWSLRRVGGRIWPVHSFSVKQYPRFPADWIWPNSQSGLKYIPRYIFANEFKLRLWNFKRLLIGRARWWNLCVHCVRVCVCDFRDSQCSWLSGTFKDEVKTGWEQSAVEGLLCLTLQFNASLKRQDIVLSISFQNIHLSEKKNNKCLYLFRCWVKGRKAMNYVWGNQCLCALTNNKFFKLTLLKLPHSPRLDCYGPRVT